MKTLPLLAFLTALGMSAPSAQTVTRVSVSSSGAEANGNTLGAELSGDGRFVVFDSIASNLVAGDVNGQIDVFVHDRLLGTTEIVTQAFGGGGAHGHSQRPVISRDGRFVAYTSGAFDLVPGDTNATEDLFLYDRVARTTARISVSSSGEQANGSTFHRPAISDDGGVVVFSSNASNLVASDQNGWADVFRHETATGLTTRVSVSSTGAEADEPCLAPAVSSDARFVAFTSKAGTLVAGGADGLWAVFLHDVLTGTTEKIATTGLTFGVTPGVALSADANQVVFHSAAKLTVVDNDTSPDVYAFDRTAGAFTILSADSSGHQVSGTIYVTEVSPSGRHVLFGTDVPMVPGDTNGTHDSFLLDRDLDGNGVLDEPKTRSLVRVTTNWKSEQAYGTSIAAGLSDDGRTIAMHSPSPLVAADANQKPDAFVFEPARLAIEGTPSPGSPFALRLGGIAPSEQGNLAIFVFSCTGTDGIALTPLGETLPLRFDICTAAGLNSPSVFTAPVDAAGEAATPTFSFPALAAGLELYAAGVTIDAGDADYRSITLPVLITTL